MLPAPWSKAFGQHHRGSGSELHMCFASLSHVVKLDKYRQKWYCNTPILLSTVQEVIT